MNQRATSGVRLIDAAKAGIEHFMLRRASDPSYATDRFFLVTFEDGLSAIKAGWAEDTADFLRELKTLQAFDLSSVGAALKKCFDMLNSNRINSPVDTYGMGRQLWTTEPASIVLLTDGGMMMDGNQPMNELVLPAGSSYYGSELYREPFRWDQRLHILLLKFGTSSLNSANGARQHALSAMALATSGSCQVATSMRSLIHILDGMLAEYASRRHSTVAIDFEPLHQASSMNSQTSSIPALIQRVVVRNSGIWPLPEDYQINPTMTTLPMRNGVPKIVFKPIPVVKPKPPLAQFPSDSYLLEPSPLVDWITEHVPDGYALECIAAHSREGNHSVGNSFSAFPPFALLSPSPEGVKLLVMPYDYPHLFSLLTHYQSRAPKWKTDFEKYLASLPPYYVPPLKNALKNLPMPATPLLAGPPVHPHNLIADTLVASCQVLPNAVSSWLDDLKEKALALRTVQLNEIAEARKDRRLTHRGGDFASPSFSSSPSVEGLMRSDLLHHIEVLSTKLRSTYQHQTQTTHLFQRNGSIHFEEDDSKHHVPINEMGDFQAYLARQPPALRSVESDSSVPNKPYFGNPFNKGGDAAGFVDEVGESSGGVQPGKKKRKRKFGIGERAGRLKQFLVSESAVSGSSIHQLPPAVPGNAPGAASPLSSASSPLPPLPSGNPLAPLTPPNGHSSPSSGSSPVLSHSPAKGTTKSQHAHNGGSGPASSSTVASSTQSFIQMQKTRKENLHKWERAQQNPTPSDNGERNEAKDPLALLALMQTTNALKFNIIAAVTRPNAPDTSLLKTCFLELKGTPEMKERIVNEWIHLASLYHVDITAFFKNLLV